MSLRINSEAPNFTAETTQGTINFHEWIGNGWAILFSHPKNFTPVCTTELGYMAGLEPEFAKRNTKIIGLSVDPVSSHGKWAADIEETQGHKVNYPMIGDPELKVAKLYDMLPAEAGDTCEGRRAPLCLVHDTTQGRPSVGRFATRRACLAGGEKSRPRVPSRASRVRVAVTIDIAGPKWSDKSALATRPRRSPSLRSTHLLSGLARGLAAYVS